MAYADEITSPSEAEIAYVSKNLDSLGVAPDVRDRLIKKLFIEGELWESLKGSDPVSTTTSDEGERQRTRYIYADGSVAESIIDLPLLGPATEIGVTSITGCRKESNQYVNAFYGCTVDWNAATWHMYFYADYKWHYSGASISNIRYVTVGGVGIQDDEKVEYIEPVVDRADRVAKARAIVSQKMTVGGIGIKSVVGILVQVCASWSRKAQESPVNA
jgi:hypothetical protein